MLYYRQKVLLALIEKFGGALNKTDLQKYLFLFTQKQNERSFDFVPYNFGCYSFQATKDLDYLKNKKYLKNKNNWELETYEGNYINLITDKDRVILFDLYKKFKNISGDNLIKYVYMNYPYYTINSSIKERVLTQKEIEQINNVIEINFNLNNKEITLFTIGYEGRNIEEYINKLIQNNIKVLVDVRRNPLSRKYGFSKLQLKSAVENFGIEYIHMPTLGIESGQREDLKTLDDYNRLFKKYEKTLEAKKEELNKLDDLIKSKKRIALTCFEKDAKMCHRTKIKDKLFDLSNNSYKVVEL